MSNRFVPDVLKLLGIDHQKKIHIYNFDLLYGCGIKGRDLIIGNVGDSRAVMGVKSSKDTLVALQLTVDLTPNVPSKCFDSLDLGLLIVIK